MEEWAACDVHQTLNERVSIILLKLHAHISISVRQAKLSVNLMSKDGTDAKIIQFLDMMDSTLADEIHFPPTALHIQRSESHEHCMPAKHMRVADLLVQRFAVINLRESASFKFIMEALDTHRCTTNNPAFKAVIMNMLAASWEGWQACRDEAEAERATSRLNLRAIKLRVTCSKIHKFLTKGEKVALKILKKYELHELLALIKSLNQNDLLSLQKWVRHHCRVRGVCLQQVDGVRHCVSFIHFNTIKLICWVICLY